MGNRDDVQKSASTLLSEEDRATATTTCIETFANFGHVLYDVRVDRQTDRHTDTLITILRAATRGEVMIYAIDR